MAVDEVALDNEYTNVELFGCLLSRQQLFQRLATASIGAKLLCLCVPLLYLLGKVPGVEDNLVLTPGFIIPARMKVWTLVTAPLYESHILAVPVSVAIILGSAVVLEPLWGMREFSVFQAVCGTVSMLLITALYLLLYGVTSSELILFASIHGFWSLLGGNLTALKQVRPDFSPIPTSQLRTKYWLQYTLLLTVILAVLGVVDGSAPVMVFMSAVVGWVYLRFYQRHSEGRKGDLADSFACITFFPESMHSALNYVSEVVYALLVRIRLCPKWVRSYDISSSSAVTIAISEVESADTQRRKQRALKELNERLSRMDNPTSAWPSLEDGPSDTEPVTSPTGSVVVGGVAGKEVGGAVVVDMEAGAQASRLAEEGNGTTSEGTVQTI